MRRLVVGVGNILMGDDGVGVHVARCLKNEEEILGIEVEDGGTGGLSLLDLFESHGEILVVDAANMGKRPGEFAWIRPEMLCARRAWSGHDHGLVDVLRLLEIFPTRIDVRILGVQPGRIDASFRLSPEVEMALPGIVSIVRQESVSIWKTLGGVRHG